MPYAVNMMDWLAKQDDVGLKIILLPVTRQHRIVDVEPGRVDGMGILLECDDERADAIGQIVRRQYERHQLRIYRSSTGAGSWKRV